MKPDYDQLPFAVLGGLPENCVMIADHRRIYAWVHDIWIVYDKATKTAQPVTGYKKAGPEGPAKFGNREGRCGEVGMQRQNDNSPDGREKQ